MDVASQEFDKSNKISSNLKIILDHPQGVFYPGNKVTGKITFHVFYDGAEAGGEPRPFLGLRIKFKGEGVVFFTDRSAGFRRKFSNDQSYLSEEFWLFGDGNSEVTIPSGGENSYEFSISLPENIPCSFEGRYGRVRYSIAASLQETKLVGITESVPFTVAPVLDLNQDPLAPLPISEDNSKVLMGQNESINMLVTLPVRGFVPGQTMPVKILLKYVSGNFEIRKLRVVFKKVITYHTERKSRRHKEIIVEIGIPVMKDCNEYETGVDVPAVPPTGMLFCSIIDVHYTLKVEACIEVNEWYLKILQKNLKTRMKIVVGTIPLRNYETPVDEEFPETDFRNKTHSSSPNIPGLSTSGLDSEKEKLNLKNGSKPPNSYEESKIYPSSKPNRDDPTGDEDEDDGSVKSYAPLYRVYTFNKQKKTSSKSRR